MKKEFDWKGLLLAIKEIEKAHKIPLPKEMGDFGFCLVCLGSNVPGQKPFPTRGFCCGAWCDGLLPPWKVCRRFKVDCQKVEVLSKSIRPDGTEKMSSYAAVQQ